MRKTELVAILKNYYLNYSSMAMEFYRKRAMCIFLGNTQIPKFSNCSASATSFTTSNPSFTANEGLAASLLASSSAQMLTYSQIQETGFSVKEYCH